MPGLSSNNKQLLLKLAREAIHLHLKSGETLSFQTDDPSLLATAGCFVTLNKEGSLRGCIGTFRRDTPLYENVIRMAVASAVQDVRFPPVEKSELDKIKIEISVLGELVKMNSMEELVLGKHGIWIKHGSRSGTYLPQVATEQKWSREEFVLHCARHKAGLTPDEISHAEIYLYEVEKIAEP